MNLPADPTNDRRAVPRHLRDTEHDAPTDAAGAGMRAQDAAGAARARAWLLGITALAAVAAAAWFWIA